MDQIQDLVRTLSPFVDFSSTSFRHAAASIVLAPLIWNILARLCRPLTRGRSSGFQHFVCYILAIWIFCFSSFRDYLFHVACTEGKTWDFLLPYNPQLQYAAVGLIALGQLFVWSSFLRLGITGTFLGDYCGILMDSRVTGFPFSVLDNPMYVGSTLSFLGSSLGQNSLTGLLLTGEVFLVYQIAQIFEEAYTTKIYQEREKERATKRK